MATTKPSKQKNSKKAKPAQGGGNDGPVALFKGIQAEFKKISWPTPQQIIANTAVVIIMVAAISLGMWALDVTYSFIIHILTEEIPKRIT